MNFTQGSIPSRVLAIMLLTVLGFLFWQSLLFPLIEKIRTTSSALEAATSKEQKLTASITRLTLQLEQMQTDDIGGAIWSGSKPGEVTAHIQARLDELSREYQISVRSITSIPTQPIGFMETIGLRVEAEADFEQFTRFLENTEHHAPALLVNRSTIRRLNRPGQFSSQPVIFFQLDIIAPYRLEEE